MSYMDSDGIWYPSAGETSYVSGRVRISVEPGILLEGELVNTTEDDLKVAMESGWDSDNAICEKFREENPELFANDDADVIKLVNLAISEECGERWAIGKYIAEVYVGFRCSDTDDNVTWNKDLDDAITDVLWYDYEIIDEGALEIDFVEA